LCGAGPKNGDAWRKVRNVHQHWFNIMESGAVLDRTDGQPVRLLSEWTEKERFKKWASIRGCGGVSSHFKVCVST
jgi:hypothetical protein